MTQGKKSYKNRSKQYEKKLKIKGTLDDVLSVSIPKPKEKPKQ